ncbi:cation diffusion facilitator family transporter [Parasedimentitalea psychrophila]|uniref:Cation diffusion facilitator family transporter n=1 Tax=Parasedimentitalea psychrophila TaxID=2997337 RepID=A0A9Y2L0F0_9RHOB|nr:cation diffusion facilitator family transporter [Parasedimentitalea psychrophila]WIY26465.1 cation diffusion facilitator family transporter [Parasedimentitalea psychrophila]
MRLEALSAERLALGSIAVSLLVLGLKYLAWWMTGSVALYSDALESLVNVGGAVLALLAVRYAQRPADRGHPYGHHKAEYFSAVAEGTMIVLAALMIVHQALAALATPDLSGLGPVGMVVNGLAMVINLGWARILITWARKYHSPAMAAGGRHLMSDVWTSVGVLAGLLLALLTGWAILDPLLAIIVALNILREGVMVIRSSIGGLMDSAADPVEQAQIEKIIDSAAIGALQVHDIRTRRAGQALFVEFHMVVSGAMTVAASHEICDRVETALQAQIPGVNTTIHVEPDSKLEPVGLNPA